MNYAAIKKESGQIASTEGLPIRYDIYVPIPESNPLPVLIFIHGFKGFKDWGAFPDAYADLAERGYGVLALNLSRNGVGENLTEFDRLDLFADQTFSQDLQDIKTVVEALSEGKISSEHVELDVMRIGMIGFSKGAHLAIVAAKELYEINCLVTWGAVDNWLNFWTDEQKKAFESQGYIEVENKRTGQIMRVNRSVYDDLVKNKSTLLASTAVKELYIPTCFIHGAADESVSPKCTDALYEACPAEDKRRLSIKGASHTFNVSHPFTMSDFPDAFSEVLQHTSDWFELHL